MFKKTIIPALLLANILFASQQTEAIASSLVKYDIREAKLKIECVDKNSSSCCQLNTIALTQFMNAEIERSFINFSIICENQVLDNNRTDVSCRNLAKTYKLLKDDENSQKYLTKSCILGNEKSCYDSAINHYNGVGIIKDEKKAKELMKKVCTSNFKDSCELVNETQDEK